MSKYTVNDEFRKEMGDDLLSIVIPCYNDHLYITTAVNSALQQTWVRKEILIVDDGSSNKTKEVLKKLESKNVKVITQDNQGPSAARNRGIELAGGKYILMLDSDDYFEPTFAEKAIDVFTKDSDVKLVTSLVKWFGNSKDEIYTPPGGELKDFLLRNGAMGSCMFSRLGWKKAGGYDEKMHKGYEDWEFYIRLLKNGGAAYVVPEILFHYRNSLNSRNKEANLEKYELEKYIYLKHAELYKKYFINFISHNIERCQKLDREVKKKTRSIEYRIGAVILSPLRWIKNLPK